MKQRILSAVIAICMMLMLFPTVTEAAQLTTGTAIAAGTNAVSNGLPAADAQGVITLAGDVTLSETYEVTKDLTIDLAGYAINGSASISFHVTNGTLTIKDSSVDSTGAVTVSGEAFRVGVKDTNKTTPTLVIESGVEVISSDDACVVIYDGTLTTNGNLTSSGGYATITGSGSGGDGTIINVEGGIVKHNNDLAIYHPQVGALTVNNGTIEGTTGIEMRAGTLVVKGGTITGATGEFKAPSKNGNGSTVSGAAVAVSQHTTNNPISVTIAGGTLTGSKALYENDLEDEVAVDKITMSVTNGTFTGIVESENVAGFISGGTFDSDVAAEDLAYGFTVNNGSVSKLPTVAKVGENEYVSLADAVAANKDTTEPVTIYIIGNATWETGAGHGSTPFGMKTTALTIEGVEGTNATFTATGAGVGPVGQESGNVTFKNLTIKDESVSYAENSWEFGYLEFRGNLIFDSCNFVNAIQVDQDNGTANPIVSFKDCTFNSNKDSEYAVWIGHGNASFEDCTFTGSRGLKVHECYGGNVYSVVVDNCTFDSLTEKPGVAIGDIYMSGDAASYGSSSWTDASDTSITIKDSTFIDCQPGDQSKYIYETDTDVTTFTFTLENNDVTCSKHKLTKTDAEAPKCEETGNIAYWTCSVCTKIFSDEAATTQITAEDTVIKATGHTDKVVVKNDATCVADGSKDIICSICNETLTADVAIPATGVHTYLDGKCTMCQTADPDYKPAEKVEMGTTDAMEDTLKSEATNITGAIDENGKLSDDIKVDEETRAKIEEVVAENAADDSVKITIVVEQVATPVEESAVPETTTTAIESGLDAAKQEIAENSTEDVEEHGIVQYLDLSVLIKAHNETEDTKTTLGELKETKNEMEFTITIPDEYLKPGYELFVLRYHDGQVDKLPLRHVEGNIYAFSTNKFSSYALAYVSTHVHTETIINAVEADCGNDGYTGDKVCSTCNAVLEVGSVIYADGNHNWSEWKNQEGILYTFRECWGCGGSEYLNASADAPAANAPTASTGAPATGDTSNMFVWVLLMAVCCGTVIGTMVYRKNK